MTPLRIIFAGGGEFGAPTLHALIALGHEVVQVVSQPDRPAGRGRKLHTTEISQIALTRNLPLIRTTNINTELLPAADVLVVIAFGQKIAPQVVDQPRFGSINLHASLLPKYRGAAPIHAAILNGESETGNSVIRLADKMDAGAVLSQSRLAIGVTETTSELHDRLAKDGAELIPRVLEQLATRSAEEIQQDHAHATSAPKINRESAWIDWNQPAENVARRIRAMYAWPGCRVRVVQSGTELDRLTLVRARAIDESVAIGSISESGAVGTASGCVEIIDVVPDGKRVMSLSSYRRGNPWPVGASIESI